MAWTGRRPEDVSIPIKDSIRDRLLGMRVKVIRGQTKFVDNLPPGKIVAFPVACWGGKYLLIELDRPVHYWLRKIRHILLLVPYRNRDIQLFAEHKDLLFDDRETDPETYKEVPPQHWMTCMVILVKRVDGIQDYIDRKDRSPGVNLYDAELVAAEHDSRKDP